MKQSQENQITMWAAVSDLLDTNNSIWSGLPAFVTQYAGFQNLHAQVKVYASRQKVKTQGVTLDKHKLRELAIRTALIVAGNVRVYATVIQDNTLRVNNTHAYHQLDHLADTQLAVVLKDIHDAALFHLPSMAAYGNTATKLADFQIQINNYTTAIPKPRITAVDKRDATEHIAELIQQGQDTLELLDLLALNFQVSDPVFFSLYQKSREIIDLAHHYTTCELTVLDSLTQLPVEDATVIISDSDCGALLTDLNGVVTFKPVSPGKHTLTVTHPDYQQLTITKVRLHRGKKAHITAHVVPI